MKIDGEREKWSSRPLTKLILTPDGFATTFGFSTKKVKNLENLKTVEWKDELLVWEFSKISSLFEFSQLTYELL